MNAIGLLNDKASKENNQLKSSLDELHLQYKKRCEECDLFQENNFKLEQRLETLETEHQELLESLEKMQHKLLKQEVIFKEQLNDLKYQADISSRISAASSLSSVVSTSDVSLSTLANNMDSNATEPMISGNDSLSKTKEDLTVTNSNESNTQVNAIPDGTVFDPPTSANVLPIAMDTSEIAMNTNHTEQQNASYIKRLEEELAEMSKRAKMRMKEISVFTEERIHMLRELQRLQSESTNIPHEKVIKTRSYESLQQKLHFTSNELEFQRNLNEKTRADWNAEVNALLVEKERLQQSESRRRKSLEEELSSANQVISRLRNERDSLQLRLDQLKANSSSGTATVQEMKTLLTLKDVELKRIKEQCERHKEESKNWNPTKENEKVFDLLKDTMAIGEDGESKREHETFKNKEMIMNLSNAERTIAGLQKQLQDTEGLVAEIEAIGKAFEESQEQNTRLIQQLAEKEDSLSRLMAEQLRISQVQSSLQEEKQILSEKLSKLEEKNTSTKELLRKSEAQASTLQDQLRKATDQLRTCNAMNENIKRTLRENEALIKELRMQIARMEKEAMDYQQKAENKVIAAEEALQKLFRVQEDFAAYRKKHRKRPQETEDDITAAHIQKLKFKLRCSVCNDRQKEVVIARKHCFHMFCQNCIQINLETRLRKCPACGKSFAETDVHPIYF